MLFKAVAVFSLDVLHLPANSERSRRMHSVGRANPLRHPTFVHEDTWTRWMQADRSMLGSPLGLQLEIEGPEDLLFASTEQNQALDHGLN